MRTNIEIDDKLMAAAMKATGLKTKKDVVEEGLRRMVQIYNQRKILKYFGKIHWEGDLEEMRRDKPHLPSERKPVVAKAIASKKANKKSGKSSKRAAA